MPKYRATTESGRVYVINTSDNHWHTEPDSGYGGTIEEFRTGERVGRVMPTLGKATEPEVGKAIFLAGPGLENWRLSTNVVSVEVVE